MIQFQGNGKSFEGYLSAATGGGPGVIVIQEWWGLVDHIKLVCDRFAGQGYTALAPDLYNGEKTTSPDEASKMFMALNIGESEKILRGAIDTLLSAPECKSKTVGIVGFCMGGQLSLYAAATNPEKVSACVDYYGIHPRVHPPFEKLKAPVLGFFGDKDESVNAAVVAALDQALSAAGKEHEFTTYKDAQHAFFNDSRKEPYNPAAAEDSWKRMLASFAKNIK